MKLKKNGKNMFRKFFFLPAGFALLLFVFFASGCTGKNVLDKAPVKKIVSQNKKEKKMRNCIEKEKKKKNKKEKKN